MSRPLHFFKEKTNKVESQRCLIPQHSHDSQYDNRNFMDDVSTCVLKVKKAPSFPQILQNIFIVSCCPSTNNQNKCRPLVLLKKLGCWPFFALCHHKIYHMQMRFFIISSIF